MSRLTAIISAVVIGLIVCLGWLANHYHTNATEFKKQRDKATEQLSLANATITDMQTRQRDVAALDAKYTGELADAKSKLDDLQRCVAAGKCGLRVNVIKQASATPGVDDATSARLTDTAERDYFTLRERIETITKQLTGLQRYVREQCLK